MDDNAIRDRIETLEEEEKRLRHEEQDAAAHSREDVVTADRDRLEAIRIELDQLWDLLRQRQALREAGEDPENASVRGAGTVEDYLQ